MRIKSDLSLRIGMIMLLMCAAFVLTVLPAAAYYNADKPLTEYNNGTVTGGVNFTYGDSYYSSKMWSFNSSTGTNDSYVANFNPTFPDDSSTETSRLYVYWTWSFLNDSISSLYDTGVAPNMTVYLYNGDTNITLTTPDASYVDWKDDSAAGTQNVSYNFPSGTYAYNVTDYVLANDPSTQYKVTIVNTYPYTGDNNSTTGDDRQSFNIQAVGILTTYNTEDGHNKLYWIDEGCDLTNVKYNTTSGNWNSGYGDIPPSAATAVANFTSFNINGVNYSLCNDSVVLITAVPAGGTVNNALLINGTNVATGVWDGSPRDGNFSYNTTDVSNYVVNNSQVQIRNGINDSYHYADGQMQAALAVMVVDNACYDVDGCYCYSTNPDKECWKTDTGCVCDYKTRIPFWLAGLVLTGYPGND